jgi:Carboxypeptidase regulatory-like domain/TonB-dependent Receptor Plug Domain/TonB dependent receptor
MSSADSQTYPVSFVPRDSRWMRVVFHLALLTSCILAFCRVGYSQSTFGTILGTVKDPSGSVVAMATVTLVNTGTNAEHTTVSNSNGSYEFVNVEIGNYKLTVDAPGFQKTEYQAFDIAAKQTARIDIDLKVASQATSVTVEAVAVVQTDTSNIAETKGSQQLTDLPVAIGTRSTGSTSAWSTLTAQPGVQMDNTNNGQGQITVAGAGPSQLSVTIDGISAVGPGTLGALAQMFPSFNSIEEIRISEDLNPAEYGGVADITTVSKSGTNEFHGGAFENVQNTDFNAADTFSHIVAEDKMNNYGIYLGGPVIFPKVYNGKNKTFFFGSFERLSLPKTETEVLSEPTAAMRSGDLSAYLSAANGGAANQLTGYTNNQIPASMLNPYAQKLLNFIYPLPNYGPAGAIANNYLAQYAIPIDSAQGDVRIDQSLGPKHFIFARWTYKNIRQTLPQEDASLNPSSPLLGGVSTPQIFSSFATSYNWVISPTVVNELRGGFTVAHRNVTFGITAQQAANTLGLTVGSPGLPEAIPAGDNIPTLAIAGFMGISGQQNDLNPHEGSYEWSDTLTWTKGKHTLKFGYDWRYLSSLNTQVFNNFRLGQYTFNGSVMDGLLGSGAATPIASFLLGYPDLSAIATVVNPDTDAYSIHSAVFAQDDFKLSQSLTLNYGLRWEYHPAFQDKNNNMVNFDPYYQNIVNGQNTGAVIYQSGGLANINPGFVQSIAPTPIIPASAVGLGNGLRHSSLLDFAPRIGFAWRVFNNNKTVLRGGYGRFIESLLSGTAIDGWSVGSSDVGYFGNSITNGVPQFTMPYAWPSNIAQPGTQYFDLAANINLKDPIIEEWDLTLEQDLGKGIAFRASYDGNHAYNLPSQVNADQIPVNTYGFGTPQANALIPFPLMQYIDTTTDTGFQNYQAGTFDVKKRAANVQFEVSYTFTRNLSNVEGAPTSSAQAYANEFGNILSNPAQPGLDYGNVPFSRRNRFLATFLYELPFGKGQTFLNSSSLLDSVVGGWQLAGVLLFQSGPFMTVSTLTDPSGAGFNVFNANGGRADTVPGVNPYEGQSINQWINPNAFAAPQNAIGRFGDSTNGDLVGPGTQAVSLSLIKRFTIKERARAEIGLQVSNAFNHPNYAPPSVLQIASTTNGVNQVVPGFGQITAMQIAEGAGPRQIQLTGRITF